MSDKDTWSTQEEQAKGVLEHLLDQNSPATIDAQSDLVSVEEAREAEKVLDATPGRSRSRVLFITEDVTVLQKNSAAQNEYLGLQDQFDEVHVIVMRNGKQTPTATRAGTNMWVYSAPGITLASQIDAVREVAEEHLQFGESIRPDIIVARDPYLAALAAADCARFFDRLYQVHVTDPEYFEKTSTWTPTNFLYRRALKGAAGIRVVSEKMFNKMRSYLKKHQDIAQLPFFQNFSQFRTSAPQFDLHQRYPGYKFFIIATGDLMADSPLHDTFSALRNVLINPRIALLVIGDGPARKLFQEKVEILGVEQNVIFLNPSEVDAVSIYKTADLMIETGISEASDKRVLQAIMAQLPLVVYATKLRTDLLQDNDSAYVVEAGDVVGLTQKVNLFLNKAAIRNQFRRREKEIAEGRLLEDPATYYRAVRDSIETTLLQEYAEPNSVPSAATTTTTAAETNPATVWSS